MQLNPLCLAALLALPAFAAPTDHRSEAKITDSELTGGPHGKPFSDLNFVGNDHKRISKISMTGGCKGTPERVSQLQLTYRNNYDTKRTSFTTHGGTEGSKSTDSLELETDEYIAKVEIGDYRQSVGKFIGSTWTRVGYLKFTTNTDRSIACGAHSVTEKLHTLEEKSSALLYFSGRQGAMLDQLVAHWIPASAF